MARDIKEQLRKLIKTELNFREIGNTKAAETYAAKIQELLIKYKFELSEIEDYEEDKTNPLLYKVLTPEKWGEAVKPGRTETTEDLAKIIAENFFCRLLVYIDNNALIFVGREMDVKIATYVFIVVMRTGLATCEIELFKLSDNPIYRPGISIRDFTDDYRYSFFCGYNGAISRRLENQKTKLQLESSTGGAALVRFQKEVDDFVNKELKPESDAERFAYREAKLREAFTSGAVAGDCVPLDATGALDENQDTKQKLIGD